MRTNVRPVAPAKTFEGAPSTTIATTSNALQLRRAVMACMLWEDTFYESGVSIADRISDLVKRCSFADAAQVAIDARERMNLRHVPLLVLREMLRKNSAEHSAHGRGRAHRDGVGRILGDTIFRVCQRADEMGELMALYWKDKPDAPLPYQLKLGLSRAIKKFNDHQLAKYDRETAVQLRDVAFLVHVRAGNAVRGKRLARLVNKNFYPEETKSAHFRVKDEYGLGDFEKLDTPDTWEVELSAGKDKKETFTRLLNEHKLGALALLRNLRNMIEAGVDENLIRTGLVTVDTKRVLPFRFLSAAKYAPRLEDAIEAAMFKCCAELPRIEEPTAVLIDHSGSMENKVSAKSEITRFDAATALAMIVRETCDRTRIFTFSDRCIEVPPRRGFALYDAVKAVINPVNTLLGRAVSHVYSEFPECRRIIVITDEQSADRPQHPRGRGYIVNVGGYQNGIGYGPWVTIDGWSEAILEFMRVLEQEATLQ